MILSVKIFIKTKNDKKGFKQENLYIACSILIVRTFLSFVFYFSTQGFFRALRIFKNRKTRKEKVKRNHKGSESQKRLTKETADAANKIFLAETYRSLPDKSQ